MKHTDIDGIIIPSPESWSDAIELIRSDFHRALGKGRMSLGALWLRHFRDPGHGFQFYFRLTQYHPRNLFGKVIHRYFRHRMLRYARRHCLQIPHTTRVGYGLYLGHSHGVIVNPETVIGNNVSLAQFITIGNNTEGDGARIHDGASLSPSCCVVGKVNIGHHSLVGAGSVVTRDIPAECTAAGAPARVLHTGRPFSPQNPWPVPDPNF